MGLKSHKPYTPSRRHMVLSDFADITKSTPERSLLKGKKSMAGRNSAGRISVRHKGGGHKRRYRLIDFKRDKFGVPAKVASVEYDPNRSARIALLHYVDGEKRYIIAPVGLEVGSMLMSGPDAEASVGNCLPLGKIPVGTAVHNIELVAGRGGQLVRSAGTVARLMSREDEGNVDHNNIVMGKAGRKRWLGIRPTVRGVAMNPVDHPMGGGEGRTSGGGHPQSPWGLLSKGKRTRDKHKSTNKYIVERRKK